MNNKRLAPFKDFAGNAIHEGDTIKHPSGETATIIYDGQREFPFYADYGDGWPLSLGLQVGEKGQAVVVNPSIPEVMPAGYVTKRRFDAAKGGTIEGISVLTPRQNSRSGVEKVPVYWAPQTVINDALLEYYRASREMRHIGGEDVSVEQEQAREKRYMAAVRAVEGALKI